MDVVLERDRSLGHAAMICNGTDRVRRHAKPRHGVKSSPAEIVRRPGLDSEPAVQAIFVGLIGANNGAGYGRAGQVRRSAWKDEAAIPRVGERFLDDRDGDIGKRDSVCMLVLYAVCGQPPLARFQVQLIPRHAGNFADALAGDRTQADNALALYRSRQRSGEHGPQRAMLAFGQNAIARRTASQLAMPSTGL